MARHAIIKYANRVTPNTEVLKMLAIKKEYIVTDDNKKKAVLIDIDTFNKMEEIIENYGLAKYMAEVKNEENLSLSDAKAYYSTLCRIPQKDRKTGV
jgi:PHD/YefM family antitoxin component YafN of YafNO toxin-antitoxin module